MLRHEEGHALIDTLFSYEFNEDKEFPDPAFPAFTVDIDDCDCPKCEKHRGELQKYSTLGVSIHTDKGVYTQRFTAEEAEMLSQILSKYAKVIKNVASVEPTPWTPADSV